MDETTKEKTLLNAKYKWSINITIIAMLLS